ncbi:sugar phosphate isomerase/epimerase [Coraliomargarita sinensis]|uniref:Sugar phosphate isomerase/epimerase n=1 Tax=Coraliomargarita sinensis TaxID=2174842 RepID=A0A317ZFF1_9BACT|nr:TIM barrel protein [Coraliomargarita sinensis]PXA03582.1 sugar phosphate isomerase/epimerase [Coraliomargarita sinensis]
MTDITDRLSLSSCWCSARHQDGYEMIEEVLGLGFKRIELSHGIRISLVPGILKAVEEGIIEVGSVHNFCPLPNTVQHAAPNLYQPSSSDSRERDLWHRYSLQTLDFAVKVGAPRIVMHSGSVHYFFWSPEARLERWIDKAGLEANELREHKAFRKRCDRTLKRIKRSAKPWLGRIHESYQKLMPEVSERGLTLGVENREGLEELPIDSDFEAFLDAFEEGSPVGYWHDCGHAQLKHQFGLMDHAEHLEKMAPRLIGFHLHDVSEGGKDHQTPGTGVIDFKMIARFVRPEHSLTLELSPSLTKDQVLQSKDYIADCLA